MEKIDLILRNRGRLASVFITLIIIIGLIFSGPAGAVTVSITDLDGETPTVGDNVTFYV